MLPHPSQARVTPIKNGRILVSPNLGVEIEDFDFP